MYKAQINDFFVDQDQVYLDLLLDESLIHVETKTFPLSFFTNKGINLTLDSQLLISVKDVHKSIIPIEDIISVEVVETPFGIVGFDKMKEVFPDVPNYSPEELLDSSIFKRKFG